LGPAKEILQIGAVIGPEFTYALLFNIQRLPETEFQSALATLTAAQLLFVRGIPPDSKYTFKHALIQDIAYEALLRTRRRELHHEIATIIEDKSSELGRSHPELLARHWMEAGEPELAMEQWRLAGEDAQRKSAHSEAINYPTNALRLLQELPLNDERAQSELSLQIGMAGSLMAIKGYGAPEVEKAFARAGILCRRMGESAWLFSVLRGLHRFQLVRSNHAKAQQLAQQCAAIARSLNDSNLMLEGEVALGESFFYMGVFPLAEQHLAQAASWYDPSRHRPAMTRTVQDPSIAANAHLALVTEVLGYPDKASTISDKVISEAKELGHPFSSAYAFNSLAWLHCIRRDTTLCDDMSRHR
jgi:predicted ATPase